VKQLLLLALLMSCSPKGATHKPEAPSVPEKVEKVRHNPELPPEGCACIKIFRPVCADGRTFGNSCEAQCHGFDKWTEGSCK